LLNRLQPSSLPTIFFQSSAARSSLFWALSSLFFLPVVLRVELIDEQSNLNTVIANLEVSCVPFMQNPNKPVREKFAMASPDGGDAHGAALELEITYLEAKVGALLVTLFEGRNLRNKDAVGKQDPYAVFSIGDKYKKRSAVVPNGGVNPYFKEEKINMWVDRKNWTNNLKVSAWSEDEGADDLIGQTTLSLLEMMAVAHPDEVKERLVELFNEANSKSHGHLLLRPQFLPAGTLSVHVVDAKGLRASEQGGRQDPYVSFTVDGQAATIKKKTKVVTDGGSDPVWDEIVALDIVDQYDLTIEVFDHDLLGDDSLMGKCSVSLLPVFKKGEVDTWVTIKSASDFGAAAPAGDVHLVFTFDGPKGIRYPQNQPGVDSFDERERVQHLKALADQPLVVLGGEEKPVDDRPRDRTFDDAEIEAAFRFMDLDKNGYIGAGELRHVLICMGEMITDEEVDMMISMVDSDGDGQVSYTEFYELITDPDPGSPDFGKHGAADAHKDPKRNADDVKARAAEAKMKEAKKKMLAAFVEENSVGGSEITFAVEQYASLPLAERKEGIDFVSFCKFNQVEPTGEFHALFKLYDPEDSGVIDFKAVALGMLNFVDMPKETKCDFVFRIFDEDSSGILDMGELMAILSANHMQSLDAVKQKATTIMKTADRDGNGELTMEEFRVVAQKFPNVLFPSFKVEKEGSDDE